MLACTKTLTNDDAEARVTTIAPLILRIVKLNHMFFFYLRFSLYRRYLAPFWITLWEEENVLIIRTCCHFLRMHFFYFKIIVQASSGCRTHLKNIVRKEEIFHNWQFLLFSQVLHIIRSTIYIQTDIRLNVQCFSKNVFEADFI